MKLIYLIFLIAFSSQTLAAEKLTLILDWFINPDHGPIIIAQEKGYFTEQGLEVEIIPPADPADPPKLVAAGKADLAVSYQPQLHLQVHGGLPLVRVGTLVATPLNCLLVLEDGPIKSIAQLSGKKVGFSVAGVEEALLTAMLKPHGLSLEDIELVNVNWSLSPALMSRQVDAVIGAFRNFELNQMDIEGRPGRAFYIEEHGIPPYDELILVAHRDYVAKPKLRKFVDALEAGVQFMVNHPEESWQLFIRGRKDLDNKLNILAWRDTLPRFALRPGALDRARYERFAEFLKKQALIKKIPRLETYAVELP